MTSVAQTAGLRKGTRTVSRSEERFVIFASSLGTVFEWYDFYLYATLAPFFAALFFPPGNQTAALLSAFATYAAGFLVRPFGAIVFGRIGDLVGRKYTFLATIVVMGSSTALIGFLPTYQSIGFTAPLLLVSLRLMQGLALGGEYGGAATYVAEHARHGERGYATSWIQTTATLGFFLSLLVILVCRLSMDAQTFSNGGGWRIPFIFSIVLLVFSVYLRLRLNESPVFQKMRAEGKGSTAPVIDSFFKYPNNKYVLLALLGACAGQGVVWYTGQVYVLFFLTITLRLDDLIAYMLLGAALMIGTPCFVFFGWLSDRVGRLRIILAGCALAAFTYLPLFQALTYTVNPALARYQASTPIVVAAEDCNFHIFSPANARFSDCDRAKDFLTKSGLSFTTRPAIPGRSVVTRIGEIEIIGWNEARFRDALARTGYPEAASPAEIDYPATLAILVVMMIYVTMVYGPIAAFLVELFPTKIRYTSMSLPYHIGNGWFGGMLPLLATAMVASAGNIYAGLWYPIGVAGMTLVVGALFLRETKDVRIDDHR